ncbi:MAG TPA: sigma-70 family RNA polymerase sigma factor [Tepidisphaeraceae bacterium]|nr:sigma-70 family RNA polymerase sigma factor [Tepidisphaeraceae bacterium]
MSVERTNPAGDRMGDIPAPTDDPHERAEWIRAAVRQHERQLVAYAANLVGDSERARDIVQEAFVRLCVQDRGKIEAHLAEWLFRVCRNLAVDIRRKERRMNLLSEEQSGVLGSAEPEPSYAAERDDSYASVIKAMSVLPKNQQEVIRLKFQHGLSYKEISVVTNLTVTNVGFLIHTGLKALRERFGNVQPMNPL